MEAPTIFFVVRGGLGDIGDEPALLEHAMAAPPSFGDGTTIVVVSPQHSNFAMPIVVETWTARPASDRDQWEQVSEHRLEVGAARRIEIDSPTMDTITCDVPPGRYRVEICGRGFSAEAQWRLRLWPTDAR